MIPRGGDTRCPRCPRFALTCTNGCDQSEGLPLLSTHLAEYAGPDGHTSISRLEPQLYRVTDVMQVLSMSRTVIYEQLRSGRLRSVKQGTTRFVTVQAIAEYIELLETEAAASEWKAA